MDTKSLIKKRFEKEIREIIKQHNRGAVGVVNKLLLLFKMELSKEIDKAVIKERERIKGKLEALMPEKRAKELADNLEMFYGNERKCMICGSAPEKQREAILDELKPKQIKGTVGGGKHD